MQGNPNSSETAIGGTVAMTSSLFLDDLLLRKHQVAYSFPRHLLLWWPNGCCEEKPKAGTKQFVKKQNKKTIALAHINESSGH